MQIESIDTRNDRLFRDANLANLSGMAVVGDATFSCMVKSGILESNRGGLRPLRPAHQGVEIARELAYRLYTICERRKRAAKQVAHNCRGQRWPEISRLAPDCGQHRAEHAALLEDSEE